MRRDGVTRGPSDLAQRGGRARRTTSDPRAAFPRIERMPGGTRVFTIHSTYTGLSTWQPDAAAWSLPIAFVTHRTSIGARPLAQFLPIPPAPGWSGLTLESQFDAVIVLGDRARCGWPC